MRIWSLSSPDLFTIKSLLSTLSKQSTSILFSITKFTRKSKAPSKAKAFAWLMANQKVNTHGLLQARRPFKVLSYDHCTMRMGIGKSIYHLLYYLIVLRLWHKLFRSNRLDWIPLRSISDMITISFRYLESTIRGKILWQITYLMMI